MARSQTLDVQFTKDGVRLLHPGDRSFLKKWAASWEGKIGFMEVSIGSPTRAYWMLKFHYGPMIDAFVRLTGNTNREYWHHYLKALFLTDVDKVTGQPYTRSLRDLTDDETYQFNERCKDHLKDMGGYLDEDEWRVYEKTKKREEVPA